MGMGFEQCGFQCMFEGEQMRQLHLRTADAAIAESGAKVAMKVGEPGLLDCSLQCLKTHGGPC